MATYSLRFIPIWLFVLATPSISVVAQSLPEGARQQGGAAGTVLNFAVPVASEPQLMAASDLVVHGRILDVQSRLSSDQNSVETEYTVTIIEALKDKTRGIGRLAGTQIRVRRAGGTMTTLDGLRLSTSVKSFPEAESFTRNEEVVMFLKYREDDGAYIFTGGEFGAYRIRDGSVVAMTRRVADRRHDAPVPVAAFFQTLRRLR